jgi:hypothetical protein
VDQQNTRAPSAAVHGLFSSPNWTATFGMIQSVCDQQRGVDKGLIQIGVLFCSPGKGPIQRQGAASYAEQSKTNQKCMHKTRASASAPQLGAPGSHPVRATWTHGTWETKRSCRNRFC